ncbi:glutamate synthase central domain-containing protein, partial [Deinococcus pimensis]|uniref:glutamate synthase central domain-containing protein n=1 Tax=Deinococcus pimensis TaxID=309888 RepID=UPI000481F1CE
MTRRPDLAPRESLYRQAERERLEPSFPGMFDELGHDACGIIANIRKTGEATHGNVGRTLEALSRMAHRSGEVRGEGDGCGIQTDIPRRLWRRLLDEASLDGQAAYSPNFCVGHFFVPQGHNPRELLDAIRAASGRYGLQVLHERHGAVYSRALGPVARLSEPVFVQVAALVGGDTMRGREGTLFELALELERAHRVHVVSLSSASVVYKVRGSAEILGRYYPDLSHPDYLSVCSIGHNRYSTNTLSTFEQVQPFTLLAHNGEINTIERLRKEGLQLGVPLTGGSDSQDLNRVLSGYLYDHGLSLLEAVESVFPPVLSEVRAFSSSLQDAYLGLRAAGGPLAQGPAAIIARAGTECVFSVDALGLRPLWFGETEKEYFWSSERGVIPLGSMVRDPAPFSPGEKMVACLGDNVVRLHANENVQRLVLERVHGKSAGLDGARVRLEGPGGDVAEADLPELPQNVRVAFGWDRWDEEYVKNLAEKGAEPIASLGFDGQLPALRAEKPNLAEFFKETVAVVTNPAIDREREIEHFSTRVLVGRRPLPGSSDGHSVELLTPVLATSASVARGHRTLTLAELRGRF